MSDPVIYRVFKLPASLLTAMREKRDQVETTNVRFLAEAVDSHLPNLVEELQRLGFGVHGGDQKVARLPFTDEAVTLGQLKEAAETVGLPVTRLLELCVVATLRPQEQPRRRRGRRPRSDVLPVTGSRRVRRRRRSKAGE
jgi:hypothetical protein